ncbi:MAG: hypothetical protein J6I80_01745, partial [Clostridia bacterium]|nr:hypothetical protein [Clostridia bacterium]
MITSKNIKRAISAFLCVLLLTGMFVLSGTNACAETPKGLDGYAKAEENACDTRFDAPNATAQEVKNLAGGGIFYIINNLGGTHPYAYKHNFGKFMENGFMLEFSDYFNESSTTSYYGYGTLL